MVGARSKGCAGAAAGARPGKRPQEPEAETEEVTAGAAGCERAAWAPRGGWGRGRAGVMERERECVLRGRRPRGRPGQRAPRAQRAADVGAEGAGRWGGRMSSREMAAGTGRPPPPPPAARPLVARTRVRTPVVAQRSRAGRAGKGKATARGRGHLFRTGLTAAGAAQPNPVSQARAVKRGCPRRGPSSCAPTGRPPWAQAWQLAPPGSARPEPLMPFVLLLSLRSQLSLRSKQREGVEPALLLRPECSCPVRGEAVKYRLLHSDASCVPASSPFQRGISF